MNFALRTTSCLLLFVTAVPAALQTQAPQESGDVNKRDLEIKGLPREQGSARPVAIPRGYALVIGIGKYEKLDPSEYLKFSETDAEAVYRVLISQQGGAFPAENVVKLIGPEATLQNLQYELEQWLPLKVKEQDRVVVYFAGHGVVKGGRGYIAPWDVDPNSPETTAYPMDVLGKVLSEKVKAEWKVLLTDACHAGRITAETNDEAINTQLSQLPTGFLNLSATGARESSFEDATLSGGFGVFSYFVIQALQGQADTNCDGVITAEEFVDYVRREVSSYVKKRGTRGESQTPTDHERDYDNNMVLAANASCSNAGVPAPTPLGSIAIEANMDGVDVYIDDRYVKKIVKGEVLRLPGQATGVHTVKGIREGYEPYTKEVLVVPGKEEPVTLRIQYRREYKRSAVDFVDRGEKLLYKRNSAFNPLNPVKSGQQTENDLKNARELFTKALKEDPKYAKAALDLAETCQLLSDYKAMLEAFRQAVQIDPTYVEARVQYAGALIEEGDPDEAIRQLTEAIRLAQNNDLAYSHLGRAYLDKSAWDPAIESADKAIALNSSNYEAYLWKADALRRQAAGEKDPPRRSGIYAQAVDSYRSVLRLTDFPSQTPARFGTCVFFGLGCRSHADRQIPYAYHRSLAFAGLCECEDKLGNLLRASDYCQRAIKYDPKEPLYYYLLARLDGDLFNRTKNCDYLVAARNNFNNMLQINPDLEQAPYARANVDKIDQYLTQCKGP
jgi:tetratricopeptide (TPR) repeat protein